MYQTTTFIHILVVLISRQTVTLERMSALDLLNPKRLEAAVEAIQGKGQEEGNRLNISTPTKM
jgi:hypothetical protein